eukprot:Gb_36035 [translate_table: standard]
MSDRTERQIAYPCGACKMERKKCSENCVLAPYFPGNDPRKFAVTHRVFGTCNIVKFIQVTVHLILGLVYSYGKLKMSLFSPDLPTNQRADAVKSMVYEATARQRDPIYGSMGIVRQLQQQISELQSQLATTQAELQHMTVQRENLLSSFIGAGFDGAEGAAEQLCSANGISQQIGEQEIDFLLDDPDPFHLWEPLWK